MFRLITSSQRWLHAHIGDISPIRNQYPTSPVSKKEQVKTPEIQQEQGPTSQEIEEQQTIKLFQDGLKLQQAGLLTKQDDVLLNKMLADTEKGAPGTSDLETLQKLVNKTINRLNGVSSVDDAKVQQVTKKYTFVDKNLSELLATRVQLQGKLGVAKQQLLDASLEPDAVKRGVRQAKLQSQVEVQEAQLRGVEDKAAGKLSKRLDANYKPGLLKVVKEKLLGTSVGTEGATLLMKAIAGSDDPRLRAKLLADKNTPAEVLQEILDKYPGKETINAIAIHPNATPEQVESVGGDAALASLCRSQNPAVSEAAFMRLREITNDLESFQGADDLLTMLSEHPSASVREVVAGHVCTVGHVVEKLSMDKDVKVAKAAQANLSLQLGVDYGKMMTTEGSQETEREAMEKHLGDYMVRFSKAQQTAQELQAKIGDIKTPNGIETCEVLLKNTRKTMEEAIKSMASSANQASPTVIQEFKSVKEEAQATLKSLEEQLSAQRRQVALATKDLEGLKKLAASDDPQTLLAVLQNPLCDQSVIADMPVGRFPEVDLALAGHGHTIDRKLELLEGKYSRGQDSHALAVKQALIQNSNFDDFRRIQMAIENPSLLATAETALGTRTPAMWVDACAGLDKHARELQKLLSTGRDLDEDPGEAKAKVLGQLTELTGKVIHSNFEGLQALAYFKDKAAGFASTSEQVETMSKQHDKAGGELMDQLARTFEQLTSGMDLVDLAGKSGTKPEVLALLARNQDPAVRLAAAGNPAMPPAVLGDLARDPDNNIRLQIINHLNADPGVIALVISNKDNSTEVKQAIVKHPGTSTEQVLILGKHDGVKSDADARLSVIAADPGTALADLEMIFDKKGGDPDILRALATNPKLPEELLHKTKSSLTQMAYYANLRQLSQPNLSPEDRARLADERVQLASDPFTSQAIRQKLVGDTDKRVSEAARQALGKN